MEYMNVALLTQSTANILYFPVCKTHNGLGIIPRKDFFNCTDEENALQLLGTFRSVTYEKSQRMCLETPRVSVCSTRSTVVT
jgi:hypothetical protein